MCTEVHMETHHRKRAEDEWWEKMIPVHMGPDVELALSQAIHYAYLLGVSHATGTMDYKRAEAICCDAMKIIDVLVLQSRHQAS